MGQQEIGFNQPRKNTTERIESLEVSVHSVHAFTVELEKEMKRKFNTFLVLIISILIMLATPFISSIINDEKINNYSVIAHEVNPLLSQEAQIQQAIENGLAQIDAMPDLMPEFQEHCVKQAITEEEYNALPEPKILPERSCYPTPNEALIELTRIFKELAQKDNQPQYVIESINTNNVLKQNALIMVTHSQPYGTGSATYIYASYWAGCYHGHTFHLYTINFGVRSAFGTGGCNQNTFFADYNLSPLSGLVHCNPSCADIRIWAKSLTLGP